MFAYFVRHIRLFSLLIFPMLISGCSVFASSYPASEEAMLASETATKTDWGWRFETTNTPSAQFIFYPGGKVEPLAYSLLAKALADNNIQVDLVDFPLDLAITKSNIADDILDNSMPSIIGGHSLGGAMASRYLKKNWHKMDGLVLLASYSLESYELQDTTLPVLSIYGELDLVAPVQDILDKAPYLPADTEYLMIKGGNHGQFGSYGEQADDGDALITSQEQLTQTVDAIVAFITKVAGSE